MINAYGITYFGYEEEWKDVTYKDICENKYEVSNLGRIRNKKSKRVYKGCKAKNEKGYIRISLKSKSGKIKKYPVHRIAMHEYGDLGNEENIEGNHKNGKKRDNSIYNLEKNTRLENAQHAAFYGLYSRNQKHYKSIFTDEEVHKICKLLELGTPISKIIKKMNLEDRGSIYSNIDKIISKKSWKNISELYDIDWKRYHFKTYSYDDLYMMCYYIFTEGLKNKEIIKKFPKYKEKALNTALKSIRAKRCYKSVINDYLSSTTREN